MVIFSLASIWAQGVKSDRCNFWILHVWSEVIHAEHRNTYGVFLNSLKSHGVCITRNEYKGGIYFYLALYPGMVVLRFKKFNSSANHFLNQFGDQWKLFKSCQKHYISVWYSPDTSLSSAFNIQEVFNKVVPSISDLLPKL